MKRIQQALEIARQESADAGRTEPTVDPVLQNGRHVAAHRAEPALDERVAATAPSEGVSPDPRRGAAREPTRRTEPKQLSQDVVERNRLKLGTEADPVAEAYRVLRTRVLQWLDKYQRNTVAMVSGAAGDGKTLSAVNLALSIANDSNHTALLVDFDLRAPSVHRYLELDAPRGLESFFDGSARIDELFVHVASSRLAVLPCVAPVPGSSTLLASNVVRDLVLELKSRYADRVILFDLPPALQGDDAIAFLPWVDSALVVIGEGSTRRADIERLADVLNGVPVVGSVLNRAHEFQTRYYG